MRHDELIEQTIGGCDKRREENRREVEASISLQVIACPIYWRHSSELRATGSGAKSFPSLSWTSDLTGRGLLPSNMTNQRKI